jgi:hypothetical protein
VSGGCVVGGGQCRRNSLLPQLRWSGGGVGGAVVCSKVMPATLLADGITCCAPCPRSSSLPTQA